MKLPQLSLRELFLLVVIAAMGCGWWMDRARVARAFDDLDERYKKLDARYDEVVADQDRSPSVGFSSGFSSTPPTFIQPNDGR
jgi:hypothetical protein